MILVGGCSFFSQLRTRVRRGRTMRLSHGYQLVLIVWSLGCSSKSFPPATVPQPVSAKPEPIVTQPSSWTLNLNPGTIAYQISRSGVVENESDSATRKEASANTSHEVITLERLGDTVNFTATVDTFSTTSQGIVTPSQQATMLPLQLSGRLIDDDTIQISNSDPDDQCLPITTVLITDVHNLLPRFPRSLSTTSRWNDSTNMAGCQGSIPVRSRVSHTFTVGGEISYENSPVLVIQRADSIHAEGEGAQQQHRILLAATGTGSATYYVDTGTGHVVHLIINQDIDLTVSTSGRANHFRQSARQEFTLVR